MKLKDLTPETAHKILRFVNSHRCSLSTDEKTKVGSALANYISICFWQNGVHEAEQMLTERVSSQFWENELIAYRANLKDKQEKFNENQSDLELYLETQEVHLLTLNSW